MAFDNVPAYWRRTDVMLRFLGSECEKCRRRVFPPSPRCPYCGGKTRLVELPRGGRLVAWSIVEQPPKEWREQAPLIVGLVELDDGTRVVAQISDVTVEELREGLRVRATVRRAPEREDEVVRYIVKFIPDWFGEERET